MTQLLSSKYPILCAPMNKVSEVSLAIACSNAGIIPSISMICYITGKKVNWSKFEQELKTYNSSTNNNNLLISVPDKVFLNEKFQQLLDKKLFSHLEIICTDLRLNNNITLSEHDHSNLKNLQRIFSIWKSKGYKFLYKSLARFVIYDIVKNYGYELFDGFVLKGPDAAGMVIDRKNSNTLYDDVKEILEKHSDIKIVPSGGIGSKQQIDQYLDLGAEYVAIGTLYAASKESTLSNSTKIKMAENSSNNLSRFAHSNQNGLIFSNIENDDFNNTSSLELGISTGTHGHIFAGYGIDNINGVYSVQHITNNLIKEVQ